MKHLSALFRLKSVLLYSLYLAHSHSTNLSTSPFHRRLWSAIIIMLYCFGVNTKAYHIINWKAGLGSVLKTLWPDKANPAILVVECVSLERFTQRQGVFLWRQESRIVNKFTCRAKGWTITDTSVVDCKWFHRAILWTWGDPWVKDRQWVQRAKGLTWGDTRVKDRK